MKLQRIVFLLAASLLLLWVISPRPDIAAGGEAQITEETKYIALTFDDGPRPDTTGRLLDGLKERGAKVTFFLIGKQIANNTTLVQRMKAEGHQVGSHTWNHTKLQGQSCSVISAEICRTDAALRSLLWDGEYWVRPPYGLLDKCQESLFSVPLVTWSVDPEDWKLKNADKDVAAVLSHVQPGDIVLMHDSVPASVDAALRIVDKLQSQGYQFVTVQELLELKGITPQPGVMYYSDHKWR